MSEIATCDVCGRERLRAEMTFYFVGDSDRRRCACPRGWCRARARHEIKLGDEQSRKARRVAEAAA
jgi:hypothetical protein